MRTVTHRELRIGRGEILRAVAAGETVDVTNRGQVAVVISPPAGDAIARRQAQGLHHLRAGRSQTSPVHPEDIELDAVKNVLDMAWLVDVTRGDLLTAGTLPGRCGRMTPFTLRSR